MDEIPPYVGKLIQDGRVPFSSLSARARRDLKPLFSGGALVEDASGRGVVVVVQRPDVLREWVRRRYPIFSGDWVNVGASNRANAVLMRRDSKAGGAAAGASVLHMRACGTARAAVDGVDFPVEQLTARHGLAACLIRESTRLELEGQAVLVENLDCFLAVESIVSTVRIAMNSAGRMSEMLLRCLTRSTFTGTLVHFPDYDPAGLADYLRLKTALGPRVSFFVPSDIDERFAAFGNKALIGQRPRNRSQLEALGMVTWPCPESAKIYDLIRESGSGLEQESLLLSRDGSRLA